MSETPPLILLPGWAYDGGVWQSLVRDLEGIATNSLAIPVDDNVDRVCEQLAAQIKRPSVLCGWSLGGMLAVRIAAHYPEKVIGVITLASNVRFVANHDWPYAISKQTFTAFYDLFKRNAQQALTRFSGLVTLGDQHANVQRQWLRSFIINVTNDVGAAERLLFGLDLLATLNNDRVYQNITCPARFFFGEKDSLVPVKAASMLQSRLSHAQEICVLPNAGHLLHYPDRDTEHSIIMHIQQFMHALNLAHQEHVV